MGQMQEILLRYAFGIFLVIFAALANQGQKMSVPKKGSPPGAITPTKTLAAYTPFNVVKWLVPGMFGFFFIAAGVHSIAYSPFDVVSPTCSDLLWTHCQMDRRT
eukprot:SAG11_NODE_15832_length_565_cov_0.875536_1_plen_104_part_00